MRVLPIGLAAYAVALTGCGSDDGVHRRLTTNGGQPLARARASSCASGVLGLALTEPISPQTGEHGRVFALVNRGAAACVLEGTPHVALYRGQRRLPFVFPFSAGHGKPRYSSSGPPHTLVLRPGSSAYFLVAKYRCDAGRAAEASSIEVRLPRVAQSLRIALPAGGGSFGVSKLDYCRNFPGERSTSPGNRIDVSAIAAKPGETFGRSR